MHKQQYLRLAAAIVFSSLSAHPILAQTDAAAVVLEEIIVTAQRTEQNVQDVPIAVTALSEVVLDMGPDIEEPCPLNLTPSATIAVMHAISDAIALTLMELKGFTKEDYHARHHRGYLGSITRPRNTYDNE